MKCTVIVATYNGMDWYDGCFKSLLKSNYPLEIIAVDNASTDGTVDYISKNFPMIEIIRNQINYGFAKANNIGIKRAYDNQTDYFFLLNQDAWIESDTVENLISFSKKNPDYGIVSPVHLTAGKNHFDHNFLNYFHYADTFHAYEDLFLQKKDNNCYDCQFVNAAAWLVTKKCIEIVGGFDTIMFKHYAEDENYCHRVLYHKMKIGIVTSTTICHDRENRIRQPYNIKLGFARFYANILLRKKDFLKRAIIIFIKIIHLKYTKSGCAEVIFILKNFLKIIKSRKRNKKSGEGKHYLCT